MFLGKNLGIKAQQENMKNCTMVNGLNPLSIRMTGSGEYVKKEVEHLVDLFDLIAFEREESIRQDNE